MLEPLRYGVFRELFRIAGINPYDFKVISGDLAEGFYPNIPEREPLISVDRLASVIWEK